MFVSQDGAELTITASSTFLGETTEQPPITGTIDEAGSLRSLGVHRRRRRTSGRVALGLPTGEKGDVTRHRLHIASNRADLIRDCRVRLLVFGLECSEIRARYEIPPGAPDNAGDREDDCDGAESDRSNCPVHMVSVP